MYTRTDSIMRSYNLILSYIHSHTRVKTRTHTHTQSVCACVSLGTRVCARACVIKQDDVTLQFHSLGRGYGPLPPPPSGSAPASCAHLLKVNQRHGC